MSTSGSPTYRPGTVAISSYEDYYLGEQPIALVTLGNDHRIEIQELDELKLYIRNSIQDYFSPNGDQCIRTGDDRLYISDFPFNTKFTEIQCPGQMFLGTFLDDLHFLAVTGLGTFHLFHTRSKTFIKEFFLEGFDSTPVSLNQIGMRKVLVCSEGLQRFTIPIEQFLG